MSPGRTATPADRRPAAFSCADPPQARGTVPAASRV